MLVPCSTTSYQTAHPSGAQALSFTYDYQFHLLMISNSNSHIQGLAHYVTWSSCGAPLFHTSAICSAFLLIDGSIGDIVTNPGTRTILIEMFQKIASTTVKVMSRAVVVCQM